MPSSNCSTLICMGVSLSLNGLNQKMNLNSLLPHNNQQRWSHLNLKIRGKNLIEMSDLTIHFLYIVMNRELRSLLIKNKVCNYYSIP